MIWLACRWCISKERNDRVFGSNDSSCDQLIDKVEVITCWWLKARRNDFCHDYHAWWFNHLPCLDFLSA
jgi:hypothetical protein